MLLPCFSFKDGNSLSTRSKQPGAAERMLSSCSKSWRTLFDDEETYNGNLSMLLIGKVLQKVGKRGLIDSNKTALLSKGPVLTSVFDTVLSILPLSKYN
jgi:hypothetical protein